VTTTDSTRLFEPHLLLVGDEARPNWGVLTRGDRIAAVGPAAQLRRDRPNATVEALPDMLLMPGTVNAHSHSFQSLLRGLGDDQVFAEWRTYLYGLTPTLDEEGVYVGALFAFGEMLLNGVTTVCDFFLPKFRPN
jgi:5-methylthioadenosine/S-adenosylhomocysteine deaminase